MTVTTWRIILAVSLLPISIAVSVAEEPSGTIDPSLVIEQFDIANDGDGLTVPVKVFGKKRAFTVDTGCTWMLFDKSLRPLLGPPIKTTNTWTPTGKVSTELFEPPTAYLGTLDLHSHLPAACHDLSTLNQFCLEPVAGILGMSALGQYVVRMNFDTGKLFFLKSAPKDSGTALPLASWRGTPLVQIEIEGHGPEEFLIDTGLIAEDAGTLKHDLATVLEEKEIAKVSEATSVAAFDLSGDSEQKRLRLKGLRVGTHQMVDVPMSKSTREGPSILGLGFWSRFVVTFDFPHRLLYLKKSKHFDRPFKSSLGGILFMRKGAEVTVQKVRPDGPADKSGIMPGDVLLEIGSHVAATTRPFQLYQAFGTPEATIHVKLKRGDEILEVDVKLPEG